MVAPKINYLIFDVESIADGELISRVRYPSLALSAEEAIATYRQELTEKTGNDFIPYTFQIPVSVVVAKVTGKGRLVDLVALAPAEAPPSTYGSQIVTAFGRPRGRPIGALPGDWGRVPRRSGNERWLRRSGRPAPR